MIILKQVIHYPDNSVEATWAREVTPAIDVPESTAPDTLDVDGNTIPGEINPAHTIPATYEQVKCHSYHPTQMQMLREDMAQWGGNVADHEAMIAAVEAAYVPPAPEPPTVPQSVTMRQARLALLGAGMLATVNAAIAAMTGTQGDAARIEWEFSSEVKRNQPLVMALGPTLGLSSAQLDALFITAAGL